MTPHATNEPTFGQCWEVAAECWGLKDDTSMRTKAWRTGQVFELLVWNVEGALKKSEAKRIKKIAGERGYTVGHRARLTEIAKAMA